MNKKMIGLAFAVLMIVGAFLPWIKIEFMGMSESMTGFMGSGKGSPGLLTTIFGVLCAIFILVNKKWSNIAAIVFALLSLGWIIERIGTIKEKVGGLGTTGIGVYVIVAACIGVVIGAVISMRGDAPKA